MKTTVNHEEIREWIERNGGEPMIIHGDAESTGRVLAVSFGASRELTKITWEEFFTIFEQERLAFTYDDTASPDHAGAAYAFLNRETQDADMGELEETGLPEDRPEMDENLYPSNP